MQHLKFELRIVFNLFFVETDDVAVAHAETRGVEIELRFLLRCYADAEGHGLLWVLKQAVESVVLVFIVENRYHVGKAVGMKSNNVLNVLQPFVTVAHNKDVFGYKSLGIKFLYQVNVER